MAYGRSTSSADIGSNFSDYRGDAMLGGANVQPIKIDLDPLQKLAVFTNLQNKTYYEQQQQNANTAIAQLSKTADIDVNNLYGKDRDKMIKERNDVINGVMGKLREVPSDPSKYAYWMADVQQKIGGLAGEYDTMKKRAVTRVADLQNINQQYGQDAAAIDTATKMYDQYFNSTDGALDPLPLFKPIELPTPKPVSATIRAYKTGGDDTQDYTISVDNLDAANKQINASILLGEQKSSIYPPEKIKDSKGNEVDNPLYTQWAKGKSKAEILMSKMQNLGTPDVYSFAQKTAAAYNAAIKPYLLPDDPTKVDETKLLASGNQVLIDNYKNLSGLNQYATSHISTLAQKGGAYSNEGINYHVPTEVDPSTFQPGVIGDMGNITPEQLILAQVHQAHGGDKVQVVNKHTGQASKNATDLANIRLRQAEFGLNKSKFNSANKEDVSGAGTVLNEMVSTIKNGTPVTINGKPTEIIRVSDPSLLEQFKDVNEKGIPDALNYDTKTDRIILLYGYKNESGGLNYTKEIPLDQRAWSKIVTKRSFPNKDIGGINSIVDQVISDNGNSLYKLSQKESKSGSDSKIVELSGKINPSTLVIGQTYSVGGKNYNWDGKKLKAK